MVTDFGIAKALSAARGDGSPDPGTTVTRAGFAIGTPAYMSPKQITAIPTWTIAPICTPSAVWPMSYWQANPPSAIARLAAGAAHLTNSAGSGRGTLSDVPSALARVIMQCLTKEPTQRPGSAGEIIEVLDPAALEASPVTRLWTAYESTTDRGAWGGRAAGGGRRRADRSRQGRATRLHKPGFPGNSPVRKCRRGSTRDLWAEGLTDEVTTVLAQMPDLRLATRASVERFGSPERGSSRGRPGASGWLRAPRYPLAPG